MSREWLTHPVPSPAVKAGLTKALALFTALQATEKQRIEQEKQLKALEQDQARMRSNLAIIPKDSAPYKRFLEKFETQETQIESLQRQIQQLQVTGQKQRAAYDEFVGTLTAE